jgi:hypothetical protein
MNLYKTSSFYEDLNNAAIISRIDRDSCYKKIKSKIGNEYTKAEFRADLLNIFCSSFKRPNTILQNLKEIKAKIDRNQLRLAILYLEKNHRTNRTEYPFEARKSNALVYEQYSHDNNFLYFKNKYHDGVKIVFENLAQIKGYRSLPAVIAGGIAGSYAFSGSIPALFTIATAQLLLEAKTRYKKLAGRPILFRAIVIGTLAISGIPTLLTGAAVGLLYESYKIYQDLGSPPAPLPTHPECLRNKKRRVSYECKTSN